MKKTIYIYRTTDAHGTQMVCILNESNDTGGILFGYDSNGVCHQYDSYELYHAYEWAEKWGFKLESGTMEIEIPDDIFK